MNRRSFMAELRSLLAFLDADDRDRVLRRYERMFNEAGEDGEAAVIRCFGSPVRQVLQIEREYRDSVARGEIPFADGDAAEEPVEDEPEEEFIEEAEPEYEEVEELPEEPTEEPVGESAGEPEAFEEPAGEPEAFEEPAEEFAEEAVETPAEEPEEIVPLEPEETAEEPANAPAESGIFSVLPDLDLDSLDLTLPDAAVGNAEAMTTLTFGAVEPPAAEPEPESEPVTEPEYEEEFPDEEPEEISEESAEPSAEPAEADNSAAVIAAIFGSLPENSGNAPEESAKPEAAEAQEIPAEETAGEAADETEETREPETVTEALEAGTDTEADEEGITEEPYNEAAAEYESILLEEEPHEPEETGEPEENEPETEDEDEEEEKSGKTRRKPSTQKEPEKPRRASGGCKFAAVVVTIPMIVMWAVLFGLSVALGVIVFALGAVFCAVGVYLATYVFGGALAYMPDILLTAGGMLVAFSLTVLLLWAGISIAVTGCSLTVRLSKSIYRSILYPEKEEDDDE